MHLTALSAYRSMPVKFGEQKIKEAVTVTPYQGTTAGPPRSVDIIELTPAEDEADCDNYLPSLKTWSLKAMSSEREERLEQLADALELARDGEGGGDLASIFGGAQHNDDDDEDDSRPVSDTELHFYVAKDTKTQEVLGFLNVDHTEDNSRYITALEPAPEYTAGNRKKEFLSNLTAEMVGADLGEYGKWKKKPDFSLRWDKDSEASMPDTERISHILAPYAPTFSDKDHAWSLGKTGMEGFIKDVLAGFKAILPTPTTPPEAKPKKRRPKKKDE